MTELKQLIVGLIRGEQSFEDVSQALDKFLGQTPDGAPGVARLLQAARESGLPQHVFVALNGQLGEYARGRADPNATIFAGDSDSPTAVSNDNADVTSMGDTAETSFIETLVLDRPPEFDDADVASVDAHATIFDAGNADTTVFPGDGDEAHRADADPEATLYADDADVTSMNDADAANFIETLVLDRPPEIDSNRDAASPDAIASHARIGAADSPRRNEDAAQARTDGSGSDDRTAMVDEPDGKFDILRAESLRSAESAAELPTGTSWPTGAGKTLPPSIDGPVAGVDREFHEGDLLRGRFELISMLGEGGMGAVWKGKDKLKEEARDRNPFVAIKLLQGDFKAHPEAFIALQRETAKQQRLAHPNIATVYDFDRDDATGTVFMTMEVLEGQPLDAFIRKLPADGLSEEEAMPLVQQLCAGLSYAHQASLVHSDLKPGNCFYTKEGSIKLLDFGIARASKTKGDAEGETTLFDPGQLGALTPTYATIEMFEGDDPDPRDDIYALAIMTYQMLTGKHPYGKKSAPKAKELGLVIEPISKLNKRQNKGLARGLAFTREERAESVEAFLESITRTKSRAGLWAGATIAAAILIGVLGYGPIQSYIDKGKRDEVIALIQQGGAQGIRNGLEQAQVLGEEQLALVLEDDRVVDAAAGLITANGGNEVEAGLALLASYPLEWQRRVQDVEAAREAIFGHYERRIQAGFTPANGRFDFPAAERNLGKLDALYPDSAQVFQLRSTLADSKTETLAELGARYKELKSAGKLIPNKQEEDIGDVLLAIKAIDPGHFVLSDKDLPFRFAQEAEKALRTDRDYPRADALLTASATYAPDDGKLKGLRYDLDQILMRIENEKRIADLESRLTRAEPGLKTLTDYQRVRDELVTLADLNAQSVVLSRIQARLKSAFDDAFSGLMAASKWRESENLLFSFARLLNIADLTRHRAALGEAENAAGFKPDLAARRPQVDKRVAAVKSLLANPEFTIDWETHLKVPYKELLALQPLGSPDLEQVRTDTARLLLGAALEARNQENFNQAREFVTKGLEFYPGLKNFTDESAAIDSAEQQFLAKRAEEERVAKIEILKAEFAERAQSNDIPAAKATLQEIAGLGVNSDNAFLQVTASKLLADAYQRLSALAAQGDDYLNAAELARQGLKLNPRLQALSDALLGYQSEIKKRERETTLIALFNTTSALDIAQVQQSLRALQADIPDRFDALIAKLSASRANQLRKYSRKKDADIATLAARTSEFKTLFPKAGASLTTELADALEPRLRKVDVRSARSLASINKPLKAFAKLAPKRASDLSAELAAKTLSAVQALELSDQSAAAGLLRTAKTVFPRDRNIASTNIIVTPPELTAAIAQLQRGQLAAAAKSLAAAKAKEPAHPEISPFVTQLGDRRKQADSLYAQHLAKARDPLGYKRKDDIRDLYKQASALCGDCGYKEKRAQKPIAGLCHPGLAGFGTKRAGQCWDQLGRVKGPMMVVVPQGSGSPQPFAIGKYEVSHRDFNVFCKASKKCKVKLGGESRLPATRIDAQLAESYAAWLSMTASRALKQKVTYRLPTAAEWEHAANAGGAQPEKKFNCRVTSGGNTISGHALVDARSGQPNGWGLANYVGNAQELVRAGGGFAVRGGDFAVPLTKCNLSISEPHPGSADETTGFRLLRELG